MNRFLALLLLPVSALADGAKLSDVLNLTEHTSHSVTAAQKREAASASAVGLSKWGYYPTLDFEAIDSAGFPGSTSALGIGGVMGSPYRSGLAYGLVAKANIWDFGRTLHGVSAAEHSHLADREKTRLGLIELDQQAARAYFDCVRYRSQEATWAYVAQEAKLVSQEVRRFVGTGQRSVIERYLAESQEEEALTSQADFAERSAVATSRLRLYTGSNTLPPCPKSAELGTELAGQPSSTNPWIANAREEVKAAEARARQARADYLPSIVGLGSVGAMNSVRLVAKKDYAVGIGLRFPIFEGWRTSYKVQEAQATVEEKEALVTASQEDLDRASARYDDLIGSAKVRLEHLEREQSVADEGYQLARKRYGNLQGTLVDLREALRNLTRVKTQWNEAQVDYWSARVAKDLFLGNRLPGQTPVPVVSEAEEAPVAAYSAPPAHSSRYEGSE